MLLIAFLVVGPKDLPRVARWLGRLVRKMRLLIREVRKETGWDDLEKEYRSTQTDVNRTIGGLQKDLDVSSELKGASEEVSQSVNSVMGELRRTGEQLGEETQELRKETMKQ